jgi:hypothetical protein
MALIDQIYSSVDLGKYMGSASLSLFGHNFVIWIVCNGPNFEILVQKFNENFAPLIFQGQNKNYPVVQKSWSFEFLQTIVLWKGSDQPASCQIFCK